MIGFFGGSKGFQQQTPQQQTARAVRVYRGRHHDDLEQMAKAMLGERRAVVGPIDRTRNALRAAVDRVNRAYNVAPLVTGITSEHLAMAGDRSGAVAIRRYTEAGGLPLPSPQQDACRDALGLMLAAGYAGVMVGLTPRQSVFFEAIEPDDLLCEYAGNDPHNPVRIKHRRQRWQGDRYVDTVETYDMRDPDRPVYTVRAGAAGSVLALDDAAESGADMTPAEVAEAGGWLDQWRDADGRPIHRIAILGRPGRPGETLGLVDAALRGPILWSHWMGGIIDAGFPSRHALGLEQTGQSSDARTGQHGQAGGPEAVHTWRATDPERPGQILQLGPGFDPAIIGDAIRAYEYGPQSSLGLPSVAERIGGAPTDAEEEAAERISARHYPALRAFDAHLLTLVESHLAVKQGRKPLALNVGVLYGDEVEAELAEARARREAALKAPPATPSEEPPTDA